MLNNFLGRFFGKAKTLFRARVKNGLFIQKKVYTSLHPKIDVGRLCCKRKNGGKGLISIKECVSIEKTSFLGFYLKEQEEQLLTEVVIEDVISDDENPKDVKT